jgi:uncharacterized protein YoxC
VQEELQKLSSTQTFLDQNIASLEESGKDVSQQTSQSKEDMDQILEEIKTLREDVKTRVGEGLQGLSVAAERISAEVISELGAFHTQVASVCNCLNLTILIVNSFMDLTALLDAISRTFLRSFSSTSMPKRPRRMISENNSRKQATKPCEQILQLPNVWTLSLPMNASKYL